MRRHVPNLLTILRFPLTVVFIYGFFQPTEGWRLFGTLCFMLSALTDLLDGILARRMNRITKFGAFLDPLADKFLVLSGFFSLLARPDMGWEGLKPAVAFAVVVIAAREVLITAYRSLKVYRDRPVVTTIWGKAKTMTQMLTLIIALLVLVIADHFHWSHWSLTFLIGGGIFASAILAAISAIGYLKR